MAQIDFWFEMASTYSHLSAQRIAALARGYQVQVTWRPFLLGPIFRAMGWDSSPFNLYPAKGTYMWRDIERRAARLGLPPIHRPKVFPAHSLTAARVATLGLQEGWGPAAVCAMYHAQFSEGRDIAEDAVLIQCLNDLGLDGTAALQRAKSDARNKTRLREASDAAMEKGLFGAPSFTTPDGELFWGDDRLEDALAWAAKHQAGP